MFNLKKRNKDNKIQVSFDKDFIKSYGLQGEIDFRNDCYVKTYDGYEACIYIYDYP